MTIASIYNVRSRPLLGAIEVNVSIREVYTLTASMPGAPVEEGSDITDHRKIAPEQFSIEGWISGASIRSQARVNEDGQVIREPTTEEGVAGLTVKESYDQLQSVFNGKEPFDVVTNFRSYRNMHFTSFVITRDADTSDVISFAATMVEIQFAEAQSTSVRVVRSPAALAPKTSPAKKAGKKAPKEMSQSTASKIAGKLAPGFVKDPVGKLNALLGI